MQRFSTSLLGEAKTLLLATDGSHFSDGAIQEAIFFGQSCRARVIILHIVASQAESIRTANFAVRQGQLEVAPHLEQIRKMAEDSGVQVEIVVVGSSKPEKTIVDQARLRQADVILMGRRGKSGHLARLVGKMTAKVIAQGFPRILIAPEDFIISGRHVLVALDGSANSQMGAREALALGRSCVTLERLTLLAVARREEQREKAEELVAATAAQGKAEGLVLPCDTLTLLGDPAEQIVATALARQVDMIILGGRGRLQMVKMLLGHVTEKVISEAHCAVLVVTA